MEAHTQAAGGAVYNVSNAMQHCIYPNCTFSHQGRQRLRKHLEKHQVSHWDPGMCMWSTSVDWCRGNREAAVQELLRTFGGWTRPKSGHVGIEKSHVQEHIDCKHGKWAPKPVQSEVAISFHSISTNDQDSRDFYRTMKTYEAIKESWELRSEGLYGFCLSRVPMFYISQTSGEVRVY
jgi:hypothetical protein